MDVHDLEHRFTYHVVKGDADKEHLEDIRMLARRFALALNTVCPDSREKSLAITKLEEVVFWANASIARKGASDE